MAGPFEVRHAVFEDATAIATAHVRSWQVAYDGIVPAAFLDSLDIGERTTRWEQTLRPEPSTTASTSAHVAASANFVAERNGEVIGFASVGEYRAVPATDVAELWAIYVHPDHGRSGAGTVLMEHAREHFLELGATTAYLWVFLDNTIGRSFYEKHGWLVVPESQEVPHYVEIGGKRLAEVRYWVDLTSSREPN